MFNLISKKKAANALVPLFKAVQQLQQQITQQQSVYSGFPIYGYGNQGEQINAYATVDDLYSIVNRITKTAAIIPIYEYVVTNKKEYGKYKIQQHKSAKNPTLENIYETKQLQKKSLELAGDESPLQYLLDHPNDFQSKAEFYQLAYIFTLLAGNRYIKKDILDAGANTGQIYSMYNLPPSFTYPIASSSLPRRCVGYRSNLYNYNQVFELEEIMHGKYANPVFDYVGNELIGLSPLQAGAKTLTTVANETDYKNQALKNAGAGGVIVNEDPTDLSTEALGSMKDDVLRELGSAFDGNNNINANKLAFLAGKWNYLKIFIDPANMQLLEQSRHTFKKLCNLYGVGDKLFNNDQGLKYDNYDIAIKELYTNAALPLVSSLCDDFNKGLSPHYGGNIVAYDISDIPELAEQKTNISAFYSTLPAFKPNDLRESLGYGRDLGEEGETLLIKSGYTTLEDVTMPVITNTTNLNNANANDYNKP